MAVNQAIAVLEALARHETGFVRTPKFNLDGSGAPASSWAQRRYRGLRSFSRWIELTFALYFTVVIGVAISERLWGSLPFLAIFFVGFWYVAALSITEGMSVRRARSA